MPQIPRHVALQYSLLINAVRVRTFIVRTYLVNIKGVPDPPFFLPLPRSRMNSNATGCPSCGRSTTARAERPFSGRWMPSSAMLFFTSWPLYLERSKTALNFSSTPPSLTWNSFFGCAGWRSKGLNMAAVTRLAWLTPL